eukprot:g980.t1
MSAVFSFICSLTLLVTCSANNLPGCDTYHDNQCNGNTIITNESFAERRWFTPKRGSEGYLASFQDYSHLVGYAQIIYNDSSYTEAIVTVHALHKTADAKLSYIFGDGVKPQTSPSKAFSVSYAETLLITVLADDGTKIQLEPIDFRWNAGDIKVAAKGDFRGGQKGAIVEMFGWPDEDITKECDFLAKNGYLGVKLYPHQESVLSSEPFNNLMNPWYFFYQPVSYSLDGRLGTRDELRKLIRTCRSLGVRVYADAVINHMSGGGNDMGMHRNQAGNSCVTWGNKSSTKVGGPSPYYTQNFVYSTSNVTGFPQSQEFPGAAYGPTDFHCERVLNSWNDPLDLNAGWLTGLTDLNTESEYVQDRIAAYLTDLLSIGFSGFRVDAAKHMKPDDLVQIFVKLKKNMGGSLPDDFITWWEVLLGGESDLLMCNRDSGYNYGGYLVDALQSNGFSESEIDKIKIWNSGYPKETEKGLVDCDGNGPKLRSVIQNDDADQQNPGSSSRDMGNDGCVLIKNCPVDEHRNFEIKLFTNPNGADDNDNDFPIRVILSSFWWYGNQLQGIPDGLSDCKLCTVNCDGCESVPKLSAYNDSSVGYDMTVTDLLLIKNPLASPNDRRLSVSSPSSSIEISFSALERTWNFTLIKDTQRLSNLRVTEVNFEKNETRASYHSSYHSPREKNASWAKAILPKFINTNHEDTDSSDVFYLTYFDGNELYVVEPSQGLGINVTTKFIMHKVNDLRSSYRKSKTRNHNVTSVRRLNAPTSSASFNNPDFNSIPSTYRGPYGVQNGCPTTPKSISVGLVLDAGFTASFPSAREAEAYAIQLISISNVIYNDQINVDLLLNDLIIFSPLSSPSSSPAFALEKPSNPGMRTCPTQDGADKLNMFASWVDQTLSKTRPNGIYHLLTNCYPPSGTIGLAWYDRSPEFKFSGNAPFQMCDHVMDVLNSWKNCYTDYQIPTPAPTIPPTVVPTPRPTPASTDPPTLAPTIPPTLAPTPRPTPALTDPPILAPTSPPTPSPTKKKSCFPSTAKVRCERGILEMHELRIGDKCEDGNGALSSIYLISHQDNLKYAWFVEITSELVEGTQFSIALTPDHYIPTQSLDGENEVKFARDVKVNTTIFVRSQIGENRFRNSKKIVPAKVINVKMIYAKGLNNPFTRSHTLMVNDVVARCDSAWFLENLRGWISEAFIVRIYYVILAPLRGLRYILSNYNARMQLFLDLMGHNEVSEMPFTDIIYVCEDKQLKQPFQVILSPKSAALFADVSGFTALAERCSEPEELSSALSRYFGILVRIIGSEGGYILKFAGDALITVFTNFPAEQKENIMQTSPQENGTNTIALRRAIQCGLRLQKELHDQEVSPGIRLSVKIGIAPGPIHLLFIGNHIRKEFVPVGKALTYAFHAESFCAPGQICIVAANAYNRLAHFFMVSLKQSKIDEREVVFVHGCHSQLRKRSKFVINSQNKLIPFAYSSSQNVSNASPMVAQKPNQRLTNRWLAPYVPQTLLRFLELKNENLKPASLAQTRFHNCNTTNDVLRFSVPTLEKYIGTTREVSIIFCNLKLGQVSSSIASLAHVLNEEFIKLATCIIQDYGGSVNKLLFDDKGLTLIACFGLPTISYPFSNSKNTIKKPYSSDTVSNMNDERARQNSSFSLPAVIQAVQCSQALARNLLNEVNDSDDHYRENTEKKSWNGDNKGIKNYRNKVINIGLTTGKVWIGALGPIARREFALLGNSVNLAARLMQLGGQYSKSKGSSPPKRQGYFTSSSSSFSLVGNQEGEHYTIFCDHATRQKVLQYVGRREGIKINGTQQPCCKTVMEIVTKVLSSFGITFKFIGMKAIKGLRQSIAVYSIFATLQKDQQQHKQAKIDSSTWFDSTLSLRSYVYEGNHHRDDNKESFTPMRSSNQAETFHPMSEFKTILLGATKTWESLSSNIEITKIFRPTSTTPSSCVTEFIRNLYNDRKQRSFDSGTLSLFYSGCLTTTHSSIDSGIKSFSMFEFKTGMMPMNELDLVKEIINKYQLYHSLTLENILKGIKLLAMKGRWIIYLMSAFANEICFLFQIEDPDILFKTLFDVIIRNEARKHQFSTLSHNCKLKSMFMSITLDSDRCRNALHTFLLNSINAKESSKERTSDPELISQMYIYLYSLIVHPLLKSLILKKMKAQETKSIDLTTEEEEEDEDGKIPLNELNAIKSPKGKKLYLHIPDWNNLPAISQISFATFLQTMDRDDICHPINLDIILGCTKRKIPTLEPFLINEHELRPLSLSSGVKHFHHILKIDNRYQVSKVFLINSIKLLSGHYNHLTTKGSLYPHHIKELALKVQDNAFYNTFVKIDESGKQEQEKKQRINDASKLLRESLDKKLRKEWDRKVSELTAIYSKNNKRVFSNKNAVFNETDSILHDYRCSPSDYRCSPSDYRSSSSSFLWIIEGIDGERKPFASVEYCDFVKWITKSQETEDIECGDQQIKDTRDKTGNRCYYNENIISSSNNANTIGISNLLKCQKVKAILLDIGYIPSRKNKRNTEQMKSSLQHGEGYGNRHSHCNGHNRDDDYGLVRNRNSLWAFQFLKYAALDSEAKRPFATLKLTFIPQNTSSTFLSSLAATAAATSSSQKYSAISKNDFVPEEMKECLWNHIDCMSATTRFLWRVICVLDTTLQEVNGYTEKNNACRSMKDHNNIYASIPFSLLYDTINASVHIREENEEIIFKKEKLKKEFVSQKDGTPKLENLIEISLNDIINHSLITMTKNKMIRINIPSTSMLTMGSIPSSFSDVLQKSYRLVKKQNKERIRREKQQQSLLLKNVEQQQVKGNSYSHESNQNESLCSGLGGIHNVDKNEQQRNLRGPLDKFQEHNDKFQEHNRQHSYEKRGTRKPLHVKDGDSTRTTKCSSSTHTTTTFSSLSLSSAIRKSST